MSARKFSLILFLVVGLSFLIFAPLAVQAADPIKIGSVLRLSAGAEDGLPAKRGVELAVEEINKAGGIKGRKLEVIFEDEKDSPTSAVNAVQKLINVDKVDGHHRSHDFRCGSGGGAFGQRSQNPAGHSHRHFSQGERLRRLYLPGLFPHR